MRRSLLLKAGLAVALAGPVVYFLRTGPAPGAGDRRATTVARADLVQRVTVAGMVVPRRRTVIFPPYPGYVKKIFVKVGDRVKPGDPVISVVQSLGSRDEVYPLRAPFPGTVVQVLASEGEYVKEGDAKKFLLRIDDLGELFIQADVPEVDMVKIREGQEARIKMSAILNRSYRGKIEEIALSAKERDDWGWGNRSQVEYGVRIRLIDEDAQVRPGMSALLDIITHKRTNVLSLGHEFIRNDGKRHFVSLPGGEISVGAHNEEAYEILGGLKEGERVLQNDFARLTGEGVIRVRNLRFAYRTAAGETPVLRGVSFDVGEGERVAIQGPSGSGKSTLLYFLGCLLRPDGGELSCRGVDLLALSDSQRAIFRNRSLGFVFQQFHLLPRADVVDNILLPTRYPAEWKRSTPADRERAIALAREVGLGERLHHLPNQLSGGQQQRVAIARALMNDPDLILADEPTGNLDSRQAHEILDLFEALNRRGKTVVLITHDPAVAARCTRVIQIRDGEIEGGPAPRAPDDRRPAPVVPPNRWLSLIRGTVPLVGESLRRNRARSALTMSGITIGVCAVLAMVTLGQFTKQRILESYAEMGVNTLVMLGHHNWDLKATDEVSVTFRGFDEERDIAPLRRVFPEIRALSPVVDDWGYAVSFGGKRLDSDVRILGIAPDALAISGRGIERGSPFGSIHVEDKSPVCVVGAEIGKVLFGNLDPIGQVVRLNRDKISYGCRVLGVLKPASSPKEWRKPNLEVYVPYTFQTVHDPWSRQIRTLLLQVEGGTDVERTSLGLKGFFESKYGKAGTFRVTSDTLLIAQMKRFLTLFTILLGAIALVSLGVGGIGITNMMLVSLSERLKEIGLRKALGATDRSLRVQFLLEAVALCAVAGLLGVALGIAVYEGVIYGATFLMPKLAFEWVFDPLAMTLAFFSLFAVGIASGLIPALRAERLQVIEALRSE